MKNNHSNIPKINLTKILDLYRFIGLTGLTGVNSSVSSLGVARCNMHLFGVEWVMPC